MKRNSRIDDKTALIYLKELTNWAKYKAQEGQPPWALYRCMQLSECSDAIIDSFKSTKKYNLPLIKKEHLPLLPQRQKQHLRLVGGKEFFQDKFPLHQEKPLVNLPM